MIKSKTLTTLSEVIMAKLVKMTHDIHGKTLVKGILVIHGKYIQVIHAI